MYIASTCMTVAPLKEWLPRQESLYNVKCQAFWQLKQVEAHRCPLQERKGNVYPIPLARTRKAIHSAAPQHTMSTELILMLTKASEIFIQELTSRAFMAAQESKRRKMLRIDVSSAILKSDHYDFLFDFIPKEVHSIDLGSTAWHAKWL